MGVHDYDVTTNECDVHDRQGLEKFRTKRSEWQRWLCGDEEHAIRDQISGMMWNDAAHRLLNFGRNQMGNDPTAANNDLIIQVMNEGYVAVQVLSISKLTDRSKPHDPARGVISIRRLLDDIQEHQYMFTRENFVCYDGVPFDAEKARELYYATNPVTGGIRGLPAYGPQAFSWSQKMHEAFDRLIDGGGNHADRRETVSPRVFETLKAWLECAAVEKVRSLRNKFIAHAADKISRTKTSIDRYGLRYSDIEDAHKHILRVTNAIDGHVLYASSVGSAVPHPQFNVTKNLDKPFVATDKIKGLHAEWERHNASYNAWLRERFDLLTGQTLK